MNILIVDDDALERLELIRLLSCMAPEFTIAGEAWDGRSALNFVRKEHVDIVITDIKMPGMDGISLIDNLHHYPDCPEIIALSAYDDFALVRTALVDGASDYILKFNLEAQTLYDALKHAAERRNKRAPDVSYHMDEESILREAVYGLPDNRKVFSEKIMDSDMFDSCHSVACVIFRIDELFRLEDAEPEDFAKDQYSILSIIRSSFSAIEHCHVFPGRTGEYFALIGIGDDAKNTQIVSGTVLALEAIKDCLDMTFASGIGECELSPEGMMESVRKARIALGYCIASDSNVFSYDDIGPDSVYPVPSPESGEYRPKQSLINAMMINDGVGVRNALEEIRNKLESSSSNSRNEVLWECFSLIVAIKEYCAQSDVTESSILSPDLLNQASHISMSGRQKGLEYIGKLSAAIADYIEKRKDNNNFLVSRVDRYISEHFKDPDLSVLTAASAFNFSSGYFTAQLKRLSGDTFSKRLARYRIEKAKELLRSTDMFIYEIGEAVGIPDQFYFSRIFKRIAGISPMEYREKHTV